MVEMIIEAEKSIEHLQEMLRVAVNGLIDIGPWTIEQRLFQVSSTFALTSVNEFPVALQEDYKWLMDELRKAMPERVGDEHMPSLRPLDEMMARALVEKVLDLFTDITKIEGIQDYQYDMIRANRSA